MNRVVSNEHSAKLFEEVRIGTVETVKNLIMCGADVDIKQVRYCVFWS